jgi:hypothetical protein
MLSPGQHPAAHCHCQELILLVLGHGLRSLQGPNQLLLPLLEFVGDVLEFADLMLVVGDLPLGNVLLGGLPVLPVLFEPVAALPLPVDDPVPHVPVDPHEALLGPADGLLVAVVFLAQLAEVGSALLADRLFELAQQFAVMAALELVALPVQRELLQLFLAGPPQLSLNHSVLRPRAGTSGSAPPGSSGFCTSGSTAASVAAGPPPRAATLATRFRARPATGCRNSASSTIAFGSGSDSPFFLY